MENRIQINGVWYVKEEASPNDVETTLKEINIDPIKFLGFLSENDFFCFEATVMTNSEYEKKLLFNDVSIKVTDKRESPFKDDFWDNPGWMGGVLENNPDSLSELTKDSWTDYDIRYLQAFLKGLKDIGWL
jgi:hypothetical protein